MTAANGTRLDSVSIAVRDTLPVPRIVLCRPLQGSNIALAFNVNDASTI